MTITATRCPCCGQPNYEIALLRLVRSFENDVAALSGPVVAERLQLKSRGDALKRLRFLREKGLIRGAWGQYELTEIGALIVKNFEDSGASSPCRV